MMTVTIEDRTIIEQIIQENTICYVALTDLDGWPYVIPMNFGYEKDILYFHSAQEGLLPQSLRKDPKVCITFCSQPELIYQNQDVACSYRMKANSIVCRGEVCFVTDFNDKTTALNILMQQYSDRKFEYSKPAVDNICIWKVEINHIKLKKFGVPHPNSNLYKDRKSF